MDCYCADLIMREYNRLRNLYKKKFTYRDLHPVIAIVLLEKSPEEFKPLPEIYIHRGETRWDSGLDMPGLTRQIFVCLDKFNSIMQNEDITTPLEAWLTVLTDKDQALADKDQTLADQKQALADQKQALADKDQALADSLADIEKLREEIRRLKSGQ